MDTRYSKTKKVVVNARRALHMYEGYDSRME